MTKVAFISVPFIRYDLHKVLALQAIFSLQSQNTTAEIEHIGVVNSVRSSEEFLELANYYTVLQENDVNNLARAWNRGIDIAVERGAEYCVLINLDVTLHSRFTDNILSFAESTADAILWSGAPWEDQLTIESAPLDGQAEGVAHFSCFMVKSDFKARIGGFDEQFGPAYHEDSDMLYRIGLAKLRYLQTNSARFFHHDRATIKAAAINNDTTFLDSLREAMDSSMERYVRKWGGLPGEEQFKTPYQR